MDEGGPSPGVVLEDADQVPAPILLFRGLDQQNVLAPGEQPSWNEFIQHNTSEFKNKFLLLAFNSDKQDMDYFSMGI